MIFHNSMFGWIHTSHDRCPPWWWQCDSFLCLCLPGPHTFLHQTVNCWCGCFSQSWRSCSIQSYVYSITFHVVVALITFWKVQRFSRIIYILSRVIKIRWFLFFLPFSCPICVCFGNGQSIWNETVVWQCIRLNSNKNFTSSILWTSHT